MAKLLKHPLFYAWFFVALWGMHCLYTGLMGRWVGLVISLTGLVAALLIVSAIQSRRRKGFYPSKMVTGKLAERPQ